MKSFFSILCNVSIAKEICKKGIEQKEMKVK